MAKQDDEAPRNAREGTEPAREEERAASAKRDAAVEGLSSVGPRPYDPNRPEPLEDVGLQDPTSPPDEDERRLDSSGAAADAGAREDESEAARAAQDESAEKNRDRR